MVTPAHQNERQSIFIISIIYLLLTKRPDITLVAAPILPSICSNPPRLVEHLGSCPQRRELRVLIRLTELMAANKIIQEVIVFYIAAPL